MTESSTIVARALILVLILYAVLIVAPIAAKSDLYQWDFKSYYYAARGDAAGMNAYDPVELQTLLDGRRALQFVYPPYTLAFFRIFANLPYPVAYQVWLGLKILLLGGLILVWRKFLSPVECPAAFVLFLVFAFGATIYVDLVTGNVSLIEQFLLWLGLLFLIRGRPVEFSAAVILASSFKLTGILFVFLLLLVRMPRRWWYLGGSLAVFAILQGVSYLRNPDAYARFLEAASSIEETGRLGNPSMLSLLKDLTGSVAGALNVSVPSLIPGAAFLIAAGLILAAYARHVRMAMRSQGIDKRVIILLSCVTFALVMPRFKLYAFILILPAAYWALSRAARMPAFAFILTLLVLPAYVKLPVQPAALQLASLLQLYYPLLLTIMTWALLLHQIRKPPAGEIGLRPAEG
jgi:hypothetical protein